MAENKTKATRASVQAYLANIPDLNRRKDCTALSRLMSAAAGEKPAMWGTSIVGYGVYHYKYASGREGDSFLTGFSSRAKDITIYLSQETLAQEGLLGRLGKHKAGKGCLYVRSLVDVDTAVLQRLIQIAVVSHRKQDTGGGSK